MAILSSKSKARVLLYSQILLIISSSVWHLIDPKWLVWIFPVFFSLSGGVLADSRRWLVLYLSLWTVGQVCGALDDGWAGGAVQILCHTWTFYLLFKVVFLHSFIREGVPHLDRVRAGVAGYLLLGVFWFFQLIVANHAFPGALIDQVTGKPLMIADHLYFSFVTLTSLGYGDIVPGSPAGKVLAILCSLSGALYLAVFVSYLVSGLRSRVNSGE